MSNLLQSKFRKHQKAVVVCAVVASIATFRLINARHAASLALEARALKKTTVDLVVALRTNDDALIRRLTTADGFAALQRAKRQGEVGSYLTLSNRISKEWLLTPNTCSYQRDTGNTDSNSWMDGCSYEAPLMGDHFSMTHMMTGEPQGTISFKLTAKGWVLDNYKTSAWYYTYKAPDVKKAAANSMEQALGNVAALTPPLH